MPRVLPWAERFCPFRAVELTWVGILPLRGNTIALKRAESHFLHGLFEVGDDVIDVLDAYG